MAKVHMKTISIKISKEIRQTEKIQVNNLRKEIENKMDEINPNMIEFKNLYNQLHQIENKWLSGAVKK